MEIRLLGLERRYITHIRTKSVMLYSTKSSNTSHAHAFRTFARVYSSYDKELKMTTAELLQRKWEGFHLQENIMFFRLAY